MSFNKGQHKFGVELPQPVDHSYEQAPAPRKSFKAVARLVMAVKRFQEALNPHYTYGKKSEEELARAAGDHVVIPMPVQAAGFRTASGRQVSGRTASGRPYSLEGPVNRGKKGLLIFKPLPAVPPQVA